MTSNISRMKNPYPSLDLEEAYKWIARLKDNVNSTRTLDRPALREALGLKATNPLTDNVIASLTHYGLVGRPMRSAYRISDLAFQLLKAPFKSTEWQFLALKSATAPELFDYLYSHYGANLPVDADKTILDEEREEYRNINRENVKRILELYLASLAFAGAKQSNTTVTSKNGNTTVRLTGADSFIDVDLGDGITIRVPKKTLLEIYENEARKVREKLLG